MSGRPLAHIPTAIILIGIPASGKSSFCKQYLYDSHVRINLDQLRTKHRQKLLLDACLSGRQSFVVDNTNITRAVRAPLIDIARNAGFRVIGYYFRSCLATALEYNRQREGRARIPDKGVAGMAAHLELPDIDEGFDELWYLQMDGTGGFLTQAWKQHYDVT